MARHFDFKDTQKWAVKSFDGKTIASGFDGYKSAQVVASASGGTAVRV